MSKLAFFLNNFVAFFPYSTRFASNSIQKTIVVIKLGQTRVLYRTQIEETINKIVYIKKIRSQQKAQPDQNDS